MNGPALPVGTRPVALFNIIYNYAGGARSSVQLIEQLKPLTCVEVIDAYGQCSDYLAAVQRIGITPVVLLPAWTGRTTMGGKHSIRRLPNMVQSLPGISQTILQLRRQLHTLNPRVTWVDSEKALFMAWLAAPSNLPIVFFLRGSMEQIRPYCALAWRRVNAVVSVAENNLHYLRTTGYGRGHLYAIHDGIDVERIQVQARLAPDNLPPDTGTHLRIVLPATIAGPQKGHAVAIRALAQLLAAGEQAELWLCGDVPREVSRRFYNRMHELAAELGISNYVHFLGWRNDVPAIMKRADIVLLPSFSEGLPVSLMEAMALARPVIATRIGGIPELVRDGVDGILIDPGDTAGLVQAMLQLSDPHLRQSMGQAGQARISETFTVSKHAQRFWEVLERLSSP